jgi:hypothetical protein
MRKSVIIAILAFVAGGASAWTLTNSDANARYKLSGASDGIDTHALTMKAGMLPSQQFDAH